MSKQTNSSTEQSRSVPPLRFPEFQGDWEKKKIGEVSEINPTNKNLPNKFIYIDLESVSNGELLKENEITIENAPSRAQRILQANDVLFQMVRPYQKNNLFFNKEGIYVASTGYAQIRTKQNPKYLFQYLHFQTFVDRVIERCTGTSYPSINSNDLSNIEFSYPSIEEQTKIASFLTAVDEKIQALKKKHSLLEQYKKGVMQRLFCLHHDSLDLHDEHDFEKKNQQKKSRQSDKSSESRFRPLRFKDENGNDFPAWEVKKLGEVFSFKVTNSFSRDNLNYEKGEVRNIHYGDIHTKFKTLFDIQKETVPFINQEIAVQKISEDNYCKKGDMIFADASEDLNDVGKSIEIVNVNDNKVLAGLHTILARPHENLFSTGFAGYLFKSNSLRTQIQKEAQGSKVLSISASRLSNILIPIPSLPEQTLIANFLSAIDEKINHTAMQIQKTEVWKKGLLQKMFV